QWRLIGIEDLDVLVLSEAGWRPRAFDGDDLVLRALEGDRGVLAADGRGDRDLWPVDRGRRRGISGDRPDGDRARPRVRATGVVYDRVGPGRGQRLLVAEGVVVAAAGAEVVDQRCLVGVEDLDVLVLGEARPRPVEEDPDDL